MIDTGTNVVNFANGFGNNGFGALTKMGMGTLILNSANTWTGGTIVSNGTLAGSGTLTNAVTVLSEGTLSPGSPIGNLTINGSLTNLGVLEVGVDKTNSGLTNSTIKGLIRIAYGGTLQLILSGNSLAPGDSVRLFYATNYFGAFANILPAIPGPGLAWNTNNLSTSGTLAVLANPSPVFGPCVISGGDIVLTGSGGYAGGGYSVLANTNLAAPISAWTLVATGTFDSAGNFAITNPISADTNELFFRIRVP